MPNLLFVLSQKRSLSPDKVSEPVQKAIWPEEPVPETPPAATQERVPEPSVCNTYPADPSDEGQVIN